MINVGFAAITFLVILKIITQIHGDKHYFDEKKAIMSSLNLAFFPLFYFITIHSTIYSEFIHNNVSNIS